MIRPCSGSVDCNPGYIIPSAHWSSIERICGEKTVGKKRAANRGS
jgi:hypothetical protein